MKWVHKTILNYHFPLDKFPRSPPLHIWFNSSKRSIRTCFAICMPFIMNNEFDITPSAINSYFMVVEKKIYYLEILGLESVSWRLAVHMSQSDGWGLFTEDTFMGYLVKFAFSGSFPCFDCTFFVEIGVDNFIFLGWTFIVVGVTREPVCLEKVWLRFDDCVFGSKSYNVEDFSIFAFLLTL